MDRPSGNVVPANDAPSNGDGGTLSLDEARTYEMIDFVERAREPCVSAWVKQNCDHLFPWQRLMRLNADRLRATESAYELEARLDVFSRKERLRRMLAFTNHQSAALKTQSTTTFGNVCNTSLRRRSVIERDSSVNVPPHEPTDDRGARREVGKAKPEVEAHNEQEDESEDEEMAALILTGVLRDSVNPAATRSGRQGAALLKEVQRLHASIPLRVSPLFFKLAFASLYNMFLHEAGNRPGASATSEVVMPICVRMALHDWVEEIARAPLAFECFCTQPTTALVDVLIRFFVELILATGECPTLHRGVIDMVNDVTLSEEELRHSPQWKRARQRLEHSFTLFVSVSVSVLEGMRTFNEAGPTITVFGMSKELMREDGDTPEIAETFNELRAIFHPSYKVAVEAHRAVCVPQVPSPALAKFIHAGKLRTLVDIRQRKRQLRTVNESIDRCADAEERRNELHRLGGKLPDSENLALAEGAKMSYTHLSPLLSRDRSDKWRIDAKGNRTLNPNFKEHKPRLFFDRVVDDVTKSALPVKRAGSGRVSRSDGDVYIRPEPQRLEQVFSFRKQELDRALALARECNTVERSPRTGAVQTTTAHESASALVLDRLWSATPAPDAASVSVEDVLRDRPPSRAMRGATPHGSEVGELCRAAERSKRSFVGSVDERTHGLFDNMRRAFLEQHDNDLSQLTSQRPKSSLECLRRREVAMLGSKIDKRSQALQEFHNFLKTERPYGAQTVSVARQQRVDERKRKLELASLPLYLRMYCL